MEELNVKISVKILPSDYSCDGQDISPEIDVGEVNTKISKSLAIIVNDPDAPGGGVYSLDSLEHGTGQDDLGKDP